MLSGMRFISPTSYQHFSLRLGSSLSPNLSRSFHISSSSLASTRACRSVSVQPRSSHLVRQFREASSESTSQASGAAGKSVETKKPGFRTLFYAVGAGLVTIAGIYVVIPPDNSSTAGALGQDSARTQRLKAAPMRPEGPMTPEQVDATLREHQRVAIFPRANNATLNQQQTGAAKEDSAASWISLFLGAGTKAVGGVPEDSPVVRFDLASVNSNNPMEDFHSEHRFENGVLFGIYDGHAGPECGAVVSTLLPSYVADALSKIPPSSSTNAAARKSLVTHALKSAFTRLDDDIVYGAVDPAPQYTLPASAPALNQLISKLRTPNAGSCALLAYIEGNDLYVACTGDSRAVLGRALPNSRTRFETIELTADQTVANVDEHDRMIDEHPGETDTLFVKGRVLGGLMPTRAFGDARYKWPTAFQERVMSLVSRRPPPKNYKTPPYVTAEPVVTHITIDPNRDKFLVLACDGLWDELSSEEVVDVVATNKVLAPDAGPADPQTAKTNQKWAHVDGNGATDLIRNAFGGLDQDRVSRLLAIPSPHSRRYRDDCTVNVVYFGDGSAADEATKQLLDVQDVGKVVPGSQALPPADLVKARQKRVRKLQQWGDEIVRLSKQQAKL